MEQDEYRRLSGLVRYRPETGQFFGLYLRRLKILHLNKDGYLEIRVGGKNYPAHRMAWFLTHKRWPGIIDHINRTKTDNRLCNLREVTPAENNRNKHHREDRHVFYDKAGFRKKRYLVKIRDFSGKPKNYGRYLTKEEAIAVATSVRYILGIHHTPI